jgi:hypothetical protein
MFILAFSYQVFAMWGGVDLRLRRLFTAWAYWILDRRANRALIDSDTSMTSDAESQ